MTKLPTTKKEANKLVIKYLDILTKNKRSDEWLSATTEVFHLICYLSSKEEFEEHAEALMDILVLGEYDSILPILNALSYHNKTDEDYKIALTLAKDFIVSFKKGSKLCDWEIIKYIKEEFE